MRLLYWTLLIIVLSVIPASAAEDDGEIWQPDQIRNCLKDRRAAGLAVDMDMNPYYLRADFDGDGRPDYAMQVHLTQKRTNIGLIFCMGSGSVIRLGKLIGAPQFSEMPDDRFLSINWEVFSKSDVLELAKYKYAVPKPIPVVRAESIALIWEDGIALVYWNGKQFQFAD